MNTALSVTGCYDPVGWHKKFSQEIGELVLMPGKGGILEIRVNGESLFSRKEMGRFPEMKELKQLVRDKIAPEKSLGHSDKIENK